jgi:hypothetical protein
MVGTEGPMSRRQRSRRGAARLRAGIVAALVVATGGDPARSVRVAEGAIRNNLISRSEQDGVQLIDYPGRSDRVFVIERNVFHRIGRAGVGLMADGATRENYQGAPLDEPVLVAYNTFVMNHYGLIGGDNLLALRNVVKRTEKVAMKRLCGNSIAAHNTFWKNGKDMENATNDPGDVLLTDPPLDDARLLGIWSPVLAAEPGSVHSSGSNPCR